MRLRTQYLILFWLLLAATTYQIVLLCGYWDIGSAIAILINIWMLITFRNMAIKLDWVRDLDAEGVEITNTKLKLKVLAKIIQEKILLTEDNSKEQKALVGVAKEVDSLIDNE